MAGQRGGTEGRYQVFYSIRQAESEKDKVESEKNKLYVVAQENRMLSFADKTKS